MIKEINIIKSIRKDKKLMLLVILGFLIVITLITSLINIEIIRVFNALIVCFGLVAMYILYGIVNKTIGIPNVMDAFFDESKKDLNNGKYFSASIKFIAFPMILIGLLTMIPLIIAILFQIFE